MYKASWKYRYFSYFFGKDPNTPVFHWNHRMVKTHCGQCSGGDILSLEDAYHETLQRENFPESPSAVKRLKEVFFPKSLREKLSPPLKVSYKVIVGLWAFFMAVFIAVAGDKLYHRSTFDLYLLEFVCLLILFFLLFFATDKFYGFFYKKWRSRYYCKDCGFIG